MNSERKAKPRSKTQINRPIDSSRIIERIKRLKECIAKHEKRTENPEKSAAKIAECKESIAKYQEEARSLIDSMKEVTGS